VTTHIISLEQSAEDILLGVRRNVEVEFLAAVPQEEADGSCGSADSGTDLLQCKIFSSVMKNFLVFKI
jgi:hypothetical protein